MALDIRPLDPRDDAMIHRFHEILWRAEKEDGRAWNDMWTRDELVVAFREPSDDEDKIGLCAFDGEEMVGAGLVEFPLVTNTRSAYLLVFVEPELRRRGIGGTLLEGLVTEARSRSRTQLEGEAALHFEERDDGPTLRFARKHGFRIANMEIMRLLPLPVEPALLDKIADESAPHHEDYSVETYVGLLPEPLQESYADLSNLLGVEAPSGEFDWEAESMTPARYREQIRKAESVGRRRYTTVAVRDGRVVALTDLMLSRGETRVQQWATIVERAHRGHRLGNAVKVANLRVTQSENPERVDVATSNAETNAHMVAINERLGFRAVACLPGFLREL